MLRKSLEEEKEQNLLSASGILIKVCEKLS